MVRMQSTISPKRTGILNLGDADILIVHLNLEGERLHRPRNDRQKQIVGVPPRNIAAGLLDERAMTVIGYCEQDATLVKAYEDRWIQVYARDSDILERITMWLATQD
jgi:hypothetical protein